MTDLERRIKVYNRQGWYPVKWAHHPKPIRDAIRASGFRPQMKQCFANCQRLMIGHHDLDLVYHEGYIISIIPMTHAWLEFEGKRVDLTLGSERGIEYLDSHSYTKEEVWSALSRHLCFEPIDADRLYQLNPLRAQWEALEAHRKAMNGGTK